MEFLIILCLRQSKAAYIVQARHLQRASTINVSLLERAKANVFPDSAGSAWTLFVLLLALLLNFIGCIVRIQSGDHFETTIEYLRSLLVLLVTPSVLFFIVHVLGEQSRAQALLSCTLGACIVGFIIALWKYSFGGEATSWLAWCFAMVFRWAVGWHIVPLFVEIAPEFNQEFDIRSMPREPIITLVLLVIALYSFPAKYASVAMIVAHMLVVAHFFNAPLANRVHKFLFRCAWLFGLIGSTVFTSYSALAHYPFVWTLIWTPVSLTGVFHLFLFCHRRINLPLVLHNEYIPLRILPVPGDASWHSDWKENVQLWDKHRNDLSELYTLISDCLGSVAKFASNSGTRVNVHV